MNDPLSRFRASLKDVAREAQRKRDGRKPLPPLDRPLVRQLLISLGEVLETDPGGEEDLSEEVRSDVADLRKWIGQLGKRWSTTLTGEMQLACTEHIQGIDPRYLSHPRFDFEYAVEARQRLERRLSALEALGETVDEELIERVAEADHRLAEALRPLDGEPGNG